MRLDDPRLAGLAAATRGLSAIVSFVEESGDHRLFIAAALLEDGEIRHVHRKLFLPTYGLFDERRFFAAGDVLRAVPSRLGLGIGIGVCEDFWHLPVPQILALDGAQILINVSSSPGRDLAATNEVGLGTATSWRTLMRTYAQLTTSFVIFCNRVGVDESISFWGGSEVIAPTGQARVQRAALRRGPVHGRHRAGRHPARADRAAAPARRAAGAQRPRAAADRRGAVGPGRDSTGDPGAEPGLDVAPGEPPAGPIGFRPRPRTVRPVDRGGMTVGDPAPSAPFELPVELAIDTDVARRVIAEFIRGQLEQAGFERAVLGLSGGIDSAVVAYLDAEAIGAERLLAVHAPVPQLVARVARRRRVGHRRARVRERAGRDHGHGRRLLRDRGRGRRERAGRPRGEPAPARQLRRPDADGRAVRPVRDLGRPGRRDRQQDRIADRLHDAVRRLGLCLQPDRRPVQEPGPPDGRRPGRPGRDHPQGPVGRPVAGPDRRDRGRLQLPGARPAPVLAGRQATLARRDGRRWASSRRWSSGSTG